VTYFADWPFNYDALRFFGGREVARAEFQPIGQARPQGLDRTVVSRVTWR
jgi:hypothetical protein